MRKKAYLLLALILSTLGTPFTNLQATPRIKVIKLTVSNPTNLARPQENIVINVGQLKRLASDFKAATIVVTTSNATTLDEDARTLETIELPSQADDLDGDGKYDEIAFQVPLAANQTRIVTIAYGDAATVQRLRSDYPQRTNAKFTVKYEGMGWESELAAWRLYFDARNAIDLYGKRRAGLYLDIFGAPEYDYHEESPYGRDIYKIGDALGIGAVGALVDGKVIKVADVTERRQRVISAGPVRSLAELQYIGRKVGGRSVDLTSRITQWAGERGFVHQVTAKNAEGLTLVTGLPRKPDIAESGAETNADKQARVICTWGHQVLKTGATAVDALPDQNLGLALVLPQSDSAAPVDNAANHLARLTLKDGSAWWYVAGAWDQEGSETLQVTADSAPRRNMNGTLVLPSRGITSREDFTKYVKGLSATVTHPSDVHIVSTQAAPQSAPLDTLHPAQHRSYAQAIALLQQSVDRTAQRWI